MSTCVIADQSRRIATVNPENRDSIGIGKLLEGQLKGVLELVKNKRLLNEPAPECEGRGIVMNWKIGTLLHRLITGAPKGAVCDHENRNTLDNRRDNLRVVTHAQNTWNRKMQAGKRPNTSGYVGVTASKGGYVAGLSHANRRINLGRFLTPEEAARAYDAKALELRGSFAILNFPETPATSL